MELKYIYKNKSNSSREYFRSFISFYYYILLNNIKDIKKLYKNYYKSDRYYDFFYKNFIIEKNILIFTLYNKIPVEFLPFPIEEIYYQYPIITFYKKKNNILSNEVKNLNKKKYSKNIIKIDNLFRSYKKGNIESSYPSSKNLKDFSDKLKIGQNKEYDYYNIQLSTTLIKDINQSFFKNHTILLFTDELIVSNNYLFKDENIILKKYYIKNNKNKFISVNKKNIIKFNQINYLSILENIERNQIINAFQLSLIKKDAYLYHHVNAKKYSEKNHYNIPMYYTLFPEERVLEPLELTNNKWVISRYILKNDICFLNLTTNIFYNNPINNSNNSNKKYVNKNYRKNKEGKYLENDIFKCVGFKNIKTKLKKCDIDFIYKFYDFNFEPNYNKRMPLNLLLWKNSEYIDYNTDPLKFINKFNFNGYINNFNYIYFDNNKIKPLVTEFAFANNKLAKENIIFDSIYNYNFQ